MARKLSLELEINLFLIYKITHNTTGKTYIGQTKNLNKRLSQHKRYKKSYIGKALRAYGIESFTVEIVYIAHTKDMANRYEQHYIKYFNSLVPNGYNLNSGGKHYKMNIKMFFA